MDPSSAIRVMSGSDCSLGGRLTRGLLSLAEPFYAGAMSARNFAYSKSIFKSHPLPRPTISVGNLTTGGTGKTPVVRWLAEQLIARGLRPAVLMRGYRGDDAGSSDEQQLLADALAGSATVVADPDRAAGTMTAIRALPQPDVFVLDDAFQHRRVARDFDLVLIDATNPFGFEHVLPRGLLREPIRGLLRADAVVITRSDQVATVQLSQLEARVRRYVPPGSIFLSSHLHAGLLTAEGGEVPIEELSQQPFLAFAGIANSAALEQQLEKLGRCVGFRAFEDHHDYAPRDLTHVRQLADIGQARWLVTTEKDWVKLRKLPEVSDGLPILRLNLRIAFRGDDERRLMEQIMTSLQPPQGLKAVSPAARRA